MQGVFLVLLPDFLEHEDTEHDMDMYLVKSQIIMILDMLKVLKQILV